MRNLNISRQSNQVIRLVNACLLALILVPLAATERLPASFSGRVTRMTVEIDGVNYGAFQPVDSLEQLVAAKPVAGDVKKVALNRDFVTDPSLYLWANSQMRANSGLKNVTLISENADGVEVARHELRMAQPVAWTVEASNPEVGGLHEKVEFAVQKIERR